MQEGKSVVYTIILGVCMLLCLLLMGKMLLSRSEVGAAPSAPEEDTAMELHITEDEIASMLEQAMPLPTEGTAVRISREGTVSVTTAAARQSLSDSGLVPGRLRTALLFLPERCKLYGEWNAQVEDGALHLACRTIRLEGFALPEQTAQALSDALAAQWNTRMEERGFSPRSAQWKDGEVILYA